MSLRAFAVLGLALGAFAGPLATRAPAQPAGRACTTEPYRERGTAVACPAHGFVAVLPGRSWALRESVPGSPRVLLSARLTPHFHVAVSSVAPASAGGPAADPPTVLRDLYARAVAGSRGVELTPPELGESRPNRPTLAYEARGLVVNGEPHRSLHVWTFARRPDGRRLIYHASWTGPAAEYDPDLPEALRAMTAGFVLLDEAGRAIPE